MPFYKVVYKTSADPDHRYWPLGPFPDADVALSIFNAMDAKKNGIGPFTFEETSKFIPDYHLVEQQGANGSLQMYALYDAQNS